MSRFFCHDEHEHRYQARRDARRGRPDSDYYDRGSMDACKGAYTEEFDRERYWIRREEDERQQREDEERRREARWAREREEEEEENHRREQYEREREPEGDEPEPEQTP